MKLHRLELEGFGPFLDTQIVDFDAFSDDGIFLITGRTGAGKSSVLDGVCFALYGGVPRYSGAERRVRSDHCAPDDPTRVTVEFSAEGRRFRVTRSPEYERPKRRGGGTTKELHRATLEVWDDAGWTGLAARPVDVAAQLDEILGLTQQQFLQVILLAQNRFARFLLAKNDERQGLLRTLFGTSSFEEYERALDERRKSAAERLTTEGAEVATLLDEAERMVRELVPSSPTPESSSSESAPSPESSWASEPSSAPASPEAAEVADASSGDGAARPTSPALSPATASVPNGAPPTVAERVSAVVRGVERADYRVQTLARERDLAAAALDAALERRRAAEARHDRQVERVRAREVLAALEAEAPRIARLREELAAAAAAESLRAPLDAASRSARAERAAVDALSRAEAAAHAADENCLDESDLAARDDELTAVLARCDAASADEEAATAAEGERARLESALASAVREQNELAERRAAVPPALDRLDTEIDALAGAAARHEVARATVAQAEERLTAARESARLQSLCEQAELTALVRADELQQAAEAWATLLRRRLAGAAGELARGLMPGAPCAVCGALEHPHPAAVDDEADAVSDAAVDAAEQRKRAAADAERLAADAARVARDASALAAARAGGATIAQATAALAVAERGLTEAAAAVRTEERLRAERRTLVDLDEAAAAEAARLSADVAEHGQHLALVAQRLSDLQVGLDAVRGRFPTVSARRADAETRRGVVRAVRSARADVDARARAARDAAADLDARLTASGIADADTALAALRNAEVRARLEATLREHDAASTSARQRLLELELDLADEPDEPIDLEPFVRAVTEARAAGEGATADHATAAGAAVRLRGLAERADAGHHSIARLSDAHAVVARLANTVAGRAPNTHRMTLETFVLAAELEDIVVAANLRLDQMSAGRYRLQHTDALAARGAASGLGLEVMDAYTGQCRPPQSLSGGETFLTSLALALGLAEVVTARAGGIRLDTLFIDEGFGSLDDDTLDLAMRTLDELRQGGRTVGVISHVAAMKDQLPAQLRVTATPRGPSVISQDVASMAS